MFITICLINPLLFLPSGILVYIIVRVTNFYADFLRESKKIELNLEIAVIEKGKRNVEILKQGQYSPLRVEEQAAIIYCGTNGLLMDVPVDKIKEFEVEFIAYLHQKHQSVLDDLAAGKLNDDITNTLDSVVKELTPKYA